jgi:type IV pilus assembly protein PilA
LALIGVLSAIAIPNWLQYQAKARRSEAFSNVRGIATAEKSFQAERDSFFEAGAFPDATLYGGLSADTMPWDGASQAAYADLGWSPEGEVRYSYEVNAGSTGCSCNQCFTASGHGDVDGDGTRSAVMYVHPQVIGGVLVECPSGLGGFGTPVRKFGGGKIYDEVAINRSTDEF